MKSYILLGATAMALIVLASNILVQFLLGDYLTWGAFTYPFAFLVTDLMNRLYGPESARKVVFAGLVVGIICSFIGTQIIGEFGPLVTLRIAVGSATAFLCAQLVDIFVFNKLRGGHWVIPPLFSSLIGSALDTFIFFSIAFSGNAFLAKLEPQNDVSWANDAINILGYGPEAPIWVSLATADFGVKMLLALIALIPFRYVTSRIHKVS